MLGAVSSRRQPASAEIIDRILTLYAQGWFPMGEPDPQGGPSDIQWVRPHERALLPLDGLHVPRRLGKTVRAGRFRVRCDRAFGAVIRACAESRPGREETWLCPEIEAWFLALHEAGHAHSIEAWVPDPSGDRLVGGMYGLAVGGAFFGESMFSRPELGGTDASKVCLVHAARGLTAMGFSIFDAQLENPHLAQFGLRLVPDAAFRVMLKGAVGRSVTWDAGAIEGGG